MGKPSVRESKLVDFCAWGPEVLKPAIQLQSHLSWLGQEFKCCHEELAFGILLAFARISIEKQKYDSNNLYVQINCYYSINA